LIFTNQIKHHHQDKNQIFIQPLNPAKGNQRISSITTNIPLVSAPADQQTSNTSNHQVSQQLLPEPVNQFNNTSQ